MKTGYYNSKSEKLEKSLKKYLCSIEKTLIKKYSIKKAQSIITKSKAHYPEIIKKMPFFRYAGNDAIRKTLEIRGKR